MIDIKPFTNGNATVHDCNILIFSISQLIFALNDNRNVASCWSVSKPRTFYNLPTE